MNRQLLSLLVLLIVTAPSEIAFAERNQDDSEIRNVQTRQQEAWNHHDAKAYASLFTDDGDVVNVVGWWWKGRAEIEQKLTAAYAFVFRDSTLTLSEVQTRFLTPDIAVAHVRWSMTGTHTPPNIPEPRQGIQTQVLHKRSGKWLIAAFQNTNGIPETPFPAGPPGRVPESGSGR